MDLTMVFSYGNWWWQNWLWHHNFLLLLAMLMAMAVRQSNTGGIAWCGMSRATPEATGCCHWATTCSILPQRHPGQQQTKQQQNRQNLLAILMAAVARRYHSAHIARWRRSKALVEATGCRHWESIAANRSYWTRIRCYFTSFFIVNL